MQAIKWTNETIEIEIRNVMSALCIDRMPSNTEIKKVTGSSALQNAIRRKGGFYHWANKLGVPIKESETKTGIKYESIAMIDIHNHGFKVKKMSYRHSYDLLVDEAIKIDVKVAREYYSNRSNVHTVGINKKYATCDIYIIYLLDNEDKIQRKLIIPSHHIKMTSLNLGKDSKYNEYIDRWDYLEKYAEFFKSI